MSNALVQSFLTTAERELKRLPTVLALNEGRSSDGTRVGSARPRRDRVSSAPTSGYSTRALMEKALVFFLNVRDSADKTAG
jgi:hypothetical protein